MTFHIVNLSFSGTAHPRTSLYFHDRTWLDLNMIQSSHLVSTKSQVHEPGALDFTWNPLFNYEPIADEYRSTPTRPVVDGETRFEDHPRDVKDASKGYWGAVDTRNAAYHSLFAGAAGHTYGNHNIWQFYDPLRNPATYLARASWQSALNQPGAGQMQYAKKLMLSRPYFMRIPDQTLIVGDQGEGQQHISATRDKEGRYAMVYLPRGQSVTVDLSKLSGPRAAGWWFDPRTGGAAKIDTGFSLVGQKTFAPPTHGDDQDWILVLDSENGRFAAPGALP
jgi:hypothetical protein